MAIGIASQPDKWSSVYRPIAFSFRSDLHPNATLGDVNIPILDITEDVYGVRVRIASQFASSDLSPGESIRIDATDNGLYIGQFRVTNAYESAGNLIAYIATEYVGDETGGNASRFYSGLQVVAEVQYGATGNIVTYYLDPSNDDLFYVNIEESASRQFERVFDDIPATTEWDTIVDSTASIAMEYAVNVYERWVQWVDGQPTVVDNLKESTKIKGFRAVNCVHPYHKEEAGSVTFGWDDNLYPTFVTAGGSTGARFLTWSRQQDRKTGLDDPFFVSFLCEKDTNISTVSVFITTYAANGTPIGVLDSGQLTAYHANTINVSPSGFTSIINDFVDYFTVRILNRDGSVLTEALRVNIDRKCGEANRRLYWRNKLGGIDQYTMKGREVQLPTVGRSTLKRTNGRLLSDAPNGTWMNRTHYSEPTRRHILTSELIPVATMQWLNDDCFESADIATLVADDYWTNIVPISTDGSPVSTTNDNGRFMLEYYYGMDNRSQRA